MTLEKLLNQFYLDHKLPLDGGINNDTFIMKVFGVSLKLPNQKFRKDVIHIHDLQHILNDCDVSWKGEGFIAGWELATGFWKYFPICIFSFWAFGYSMLLYPKSVYKGFKKGLNNKGIIDLKINKSDLMKMEFDEFMKITKKEKKIKMGLFQWVQFLFFSIISQIILWFPILLIILGYFVLSYFF